MYNEAFDNIFRCFVFSIMIYLQSANELLNNRMRFRDHVYEYAVCECLSFISKRTIVYFVIYLISEEYSEAKVSAGIHLKGIETQGVYIFNFLQKLIVLYQFVIIYNNQFSIKVANEMEKGSIYTPLSYKLSESYF